MNEKPYFAYFAVQKGNESRVPSFAIGERQYIDGVISKWSGKSSEEKPEEPEEATLPDFTHESALTEALSSSVDFALSQYQLVMAASTAPGIFRAVVASERVLHPTIEGADVVADEENGTIYGLSEDQYFAYTERRDTLIQMRKGVAAFPSATLMSLVATFDTLIVDILSKMLHLDKAWLEKSERTIPFARLNSASSLDDLFEEAVADEIYQFSRGSHDEQAKYIEVTFGVGIKKSWKRWADYIEVFERRNLVAHGERKFNKRYVSICKNAGHKGSDKILGEQVELTPLYLNQAVDILTEFAVLLPFSLWRKSVKDKEEQAFLNLNEAAFKLISNRRYAPANRILEFALSLEKVGMSAGTKQMLVVNRASALRHLKEPDQAAQLLDTVDWSASSDLFQICVAAIRGDNDRVCELLAPLKGADALDARSFKQWPCFEFAREDDGVRAKFEAVFGEPLRIAASTVTSVSASDATGEDQATKVAEPLDGTVH